MKYDFDEIIKRKNTGSLKWDMADSIFGGHDLLPVWVADMDFRSPPEVTEALIRRVKHGVYGYSLMDEQAVNAMADWCGARHGWRPEKEWIVFSPGIAPAMNLLVRSLTGPGDGVVVQRPVYHPFMHIVENNGRRVVNSPLEMNSAGRYVMNMSDLEHRLSDPSVKMMFLCSPHNPGGRVWEKSELSGLLEICSANNVTVISDEIHCDLLLKGKRHHPLLSLCHGSENVISCISPSKTFNLAGLQLSGIIIPDPDQRSRFTRELNMNSMSEPNCFAAAAMEAAYTYGAPWLNELIQYIENNLSILKNFLDENLNRTVLMEPEATYLAWVDFRGYGLNRDTLKKLFVNHAGVAPGFGYIFGPEGEGWIRFNLACPSSVLKSALAKIATAFKSIK